jgi:hypothetical protein
MVGIPCQGIFYMCYFFLALFLSACYGLSMETKKITPQIEKRLLERYGTNVAVAQALGIGYRRYCQIRQRGETLSRRLAIIIDMLLKK